MSAHIQVFLFKADRGWVYNVENHGTIRTVSKRFWFKKNAEKAAKDTARQLKAKYVGYDE